MTQRLIGDFNGDGRSDVAYGTSSWSYRKQGSREIEYEYYSCSAGISNVHLSSGKGFDTLNGVIVFNGNEKDECTGYPNLSTALGDFDGDLNTDIVVSKKILELNNKGVLTAQSYSLPSSVTALGDFDGDGATDVLTSSGKSREVFFATGSGFLGSQAVHLRLQGRASRRSPMSTATGATTSSTSRSESPTSRTVRLASGTGFVDLKAITGGAGTVADVNGDGRSDLLASVTQSKITTYNRLISIGRGLRNRVHRPVGGNAEARSPRPQWRRTRRCYGSLPASGVPLAHAQGVATSSWSVGSSVFVGAGDFNGDGLPDFLLGSKTDSTAWNGKIAYSKGPQPDLLTAVRNPMGGVTTIAYQSSSAANGTSAAALKAPTTRLPFVMQTVASVTADDGLGLASSKATTRYAYAGGKWDAKERRFLGFKTVAVTHPCNTGETACPKTVITARQDLAAAGAPNASRSRTAAGPSSGRSRGPGQATTRRHRSRLW